jgi:hypothetical protein
VRALSQIIACEIAPLNNLRTVNAVGHSLCPFDLLA